MLYHPLLLLLPPDHLVHHSSVALNKLHDFCADIFVGIGRYWDAVVTVLYHFDCYVHCLKEVMLVNAGEDETAFV